MADVAVGDVILVKSYQQRMDSLLSSWDQARVLQIDGHDINVQFLNGGRRLQFHTVKDYDQGTSWK